MAITPVNRSKITERLIEAGIIPAECCEWRLIGTAGGVWTVESKCYVDEQTLATIANALMDEKAELVRRAILTSDSGAVQVGPIEY